MCLFGSLMRLLLRKVTLGSATNRKLTDDPLVNLLAMAFHGLILLIGDEMPEQIALYF